MHTSPGPRASIRRVGQRPGRLNCTYLEFSGHPGGDEDIPLFQGNYLLTQSCETVVEGP